MSITFFKKLKNKLKIEYYFLKKKFNFQILHSDTINKNYILKFLPKNPIIIDAGAHVGGDSIEMIRFFPGSTVHAFEPVPEIFETLKYNTRKFKRIFCYPLALSNKSGENNLNISSGSSDGSSSFLRPKGHLKDHPDVFFTREIKVKTLTLDDWAEINCIKKIDFLWLDMQGFELEVMKASPLILSTVQVIHLEVSTRETYESVPLYNEVKDWLISQDFRVEIEAIPLGWDMGNVLFVRK
jgi:FkbM family methyltransferase